MFHIPYLLAFYCVRHHLDIIPCFWGNWHVSLVLKFEIWQWNEWFWFGQLVLFLIALLRSHFYKTRFVKNSKMSDWDTVTVLKKRAPKASTMKSEQAVNAARRQGIAVDTQLKCKVMVGNILKIQFPLLFSAYGCIGIDCSIICPLIFIQGFELVRVDRRLFF